MLLTAPRHAPTLPEVDEGGARRTLCDQIGRLESELAAYPVGAPVRSAAGPRLLSLGELETVRDELSDRVAAARAAQAARTAVHAENRRRIERMLLDPAGHRWQRVSRADIGEPGCGHWHVVPRLGLIGMLAGWWHVKLSSGCPLPGRHPG